MKIEVIGRLRENIEKDRSWSEVKLMSVKDKDDKILFNGTQGDPPQIGFVGSADKNGKLLELHPHNLHPTKGEKVRQILESFGYKFEHPTLILEGKEGWFTILTPGRTPHQAMVHWDGKQADFFSIVPEQLLIE